MRDGRPRASTIAEVARRANVSPATVSRVMNGRFVGDPEVAERVRRAARELNYSPSPLARSLALGETRTIAFVVPDIGNPIFQAMLSSLAKSAAADGYRVLIADSAEDPDEEALLAVETRRGCDGLVLCAPRMSAERLGTLLPLLRPVVLINRHGPRFDAPSLSVDYGSGVQHIAEHLHALGHRHFVYLEGPSQSVTNRFRIEGLTSFAERVGDVQIERLPAGSSSADGYGQAGAVCETGATAVLAYNDLVAVGLMGALAQHGVAVPRDISVAGFDDIPLVRYVTPRLTTVSVPYETLGIEAWNRMHALMKGETPAHSMVFQPDLQARDSTAAPAVRPDDTVVGQLEGSA